MRGRTQIRTLIIFAEKIQSRTISLPRARSLSLLSPGGLKLLVYEALSLMLLVYEALRSTHSHSILLLTLSSSSPSPAFLSSALLILLLASTTPLPPPSPCLRCFCLPQNKNSSIQPEVRRIHKKKKCRGTMDSYNKKSLALAAFFLFAATSALRVSLALICRNK